MRSRRLAGSAAAALALGACAQLPAPVPGDDNDPLAAEAVLATMDRYLAAIAAKDHATMKALDMPGGMTWSARRNAAGEMVVSARPATWWTDPANESDSALQERYWNPTVLVRGPVAMVWAPYEFKVDGKVSHCGVDVFDFVKVDGSWRLANAMWTVEPEACDTLRPTPGTRIRP